MKYLKIIMIMTISICSLYINNVNAHPGRTDSRGCHTCRTNCEKWGLSYDEYHCHNGGGSSSSNNNNSNTYIKPVIEEKKSNNTNIEKITIEGQNITVKQNMEYVTTEEYIDIEATPKDNKTNIAINNKHLEHGNNKISIIATAEDGSEKTYNLTVILKNDDTSIKKIIINDEQINISTSQTTFDYKTSEETVDIKATPNDEYAKIYYDETVNLQEGNNEIVIKVVAENGDEKEYAVNITKIEEVGTVGIIVFLLIMGAIGIIIYKNVTKNINKNTKLKKGK